jgi:hypothetical protein
MKLPAALAGAVLTGGLVLLTGQAAEASAPSSNCWANEGGNTSYGGCLGSPFGGTYFRVHTTCATWWGWVYDAPGSGVGYSPPGRSQNAPQQGGSCGSNSAVDAWVESW